MAILHTFRLPSLLCAILLATFLLPAPALAALSDEDFLKLCEDGPPEAVQQALQDGANVQARDAFVRTALMQAAHRGRLETVRLLLSAGAEREYADGCHEISFHKG